MVPQPRMKISSTRESARAGRARLDARTMIADVRCG